MKNQLLLATLILIALPCLAVASREGGLASPEQSRWATPYILGGGTIQHSQFTIHSSQTLPIILGEGGAPSAQLTPPSGAGPLKLTLETTLAEDPIDGVLFFIGEQLYGFEATPESNYLVKLDLATGEVLSREKLATSTESSSEIGLYLSSDKSGASILRASPPALEDFNILSRGSLNEAELVTPEPWRRRTQDDLVAFAPTTGRAIISSPTRLDPSDLQLVEASSAPASVFSRQSLPLQEITIQLVKMPVTPEPDKVGVGGPASESAMDAPNASVAHLRTRELTIFHVTP